MGYLDFIKSKQRTVKPMGFEIDESTLPSAMKPFQNRIVPWALRRGRAALFEDCGLGKTLQQLAWGQAVVEHTNKPVLLLCPLGVRQQTIREAKKFGIRVNCKIVNEASEVEIGINVVNYDKLHLIDCSVFSGIILDESSVLKNFTGKIKQALIESFSSTPYRLCCTATPAPNDHMELGNHADFLGIMPSSEMLSRWFINDTMKAGGYRLKQHGQADFWRWVASWAVCISKPSDIGDDDAGYVLPELEVRRHVVTADIDDAPEGMLFNVSGVSATSIHDEKRLTLTARTERTVELLAEIDDACLIWCDTNYEADELVKRLPEAIEVRGSESIEAKERKLTSFSDGESRVLISKPKIAGHGMNWQHCNRIIFAGIGFSFESYYQAVRRCWRFGQTRPVIVDIVTADTESAITSALARKELDHYLMQSGMADAMRKATLQELGIERVRDEYTPTKEITLPNWLTKKDEPCQA